MKIPKILSAGLLFALCACSEDSLEGLNENQNPIIPETSDLFSFATREYEKVNISAVGSNGMVFAGMPFSVYTESPYSEGGNRIKDLYPVYIGYTNKAGVLSAEVAIPSDIEEVYVIPEGIGFGGPQLVKTSQLGSVVFQSTFKSSDLKSTTGAVADRDAVELSSALNIWSYYDLDSETDAADEKHLKYSELVSDNSDIMTRTGLISRTSMQFPEMGHPNQNYFYSAEFLKRTENNLEVAEDGEVYITHLGDCGLSKGMYAIYLNTLCYYTYDDESEVNDYSKIASLRKTVAIPNTTREEDGKRIQLLYWNGEKYVKDFPKGKKIGFLWIRGGMGECGKIVNYNAKLDSDYKSKGTWDLDNGLSLYMHSSLNDNSYEKINSMKEDDSRFIQSYGIDIEGEKNSSVVGFEITQVFQKDPWSDRDYNDMLIYVENAYSVIPPGPNVVKHSISGTLVYEDNWPWEGDYDFNDQVVDYVYTVYKTYDANTTPTNDIAQIELEFSVKAIGAQFRNGFAIRLPFKTANINEAKSGFYIDDKLNGSLNITDDGDGIVVTVYADTRDAFDGADGYINTVKGWDPIVSSETSRSIKIDFVLPIEENPTINFYTYNPFIFKSDNPKHEIHLPDMKGTENMDTSLFGRGKDCSDPSKNIYFRQDDHNYVWALDIPTTTATDKNNKIIRKTWRYPVEFTRIDLAYTGYNNWVENQFNEKEDNRWYNNPDESKVYLKK